MVIGPTMIPENEWPLPQPPAIDNWTENYCLQAWDPATEYGVWLHLGLPVYDQGVWHDMSIVYLPGGEEVLAIKGFAPRAWQKDPLVGAMLRGDYDADSGIWTWRFHGSAIRYRRSELNGGRATDGPAESVRFELRYTPRAPVWDASGHVQNQTWSASGAHWEQHCDVEGWIEHEGQRSTFGGVGIRDHSRGQRNFKNMGPHYWLHGLFGDGSSFCVLYVSGLEPGVATLNKAYVVRDGQLEDAQVVALPADRSFKGPVEIVIRDSRGEHRITIELLHDCPFTIHYPNEHFYGLDSSGECHWVREGQARFTWGGKVGYGYVERSVKVGQNGRETLVSVSPVRHES